MAELDIAAFLRARLDEREERASDVHTGDCDVHSGSWTVKCDCGETAFVLADVAAKRQIIEQYELADGGMTGQILRNCLDTPIRLLALPFAGHPDYREDFRP